MKGISTYLKVLFTSLLLALIATSCQEEKEIKQVSKTHNGYTITGNIYDNDATKLYLVDANNTIVDSARITNTAFQLQGTVQNPGDYHLVVNDIPQPRTILLENNNYTVLIHKDDMMIAGGDLQSKLTAYHRTGALQDQHRLMVLNNFLAKDITNKQMQFSLDSIAAIQTAHTIRFIEDNQDNPLASIGLDGAILTLDAALNLTENTKNAKNTVFVNTLKEQLAVLQKEEETRVAAIKKAEAVKVYRAPAPYFTGESLNGRDVAFANVIQGKKAVLIDFWASWCKPCRMVTPEVRSIYHKYKDQGFDVITVSEDKNRAAWQQGVLEDQMSSWNHVYDEYKSIAGLYGVRALPHMVLVDANGNIIKDKIGIRQLKSELTKIFNK